MTIELTEPLANAIIDMDDIAYDGGFVPKLKSSVNAWEHLLKMAEDLVQVKSVRHHFQSDGA